MGVTGATTINNTLDVSGNVNIHGDKFQINATSGDTVIAGDMTVSNRVFVTGDISINGDILPKNNTVSLGSAANKFANIYTKNLHVDQNTITFQTETGANAGSIGMTNGSLEVADQSGKKINTVGLTEDPNTGLKYLHNLDISGDLTLIHGDVSFNNNLFVSGNTHTNGTLDVTGATTTAALSATNVTTSGTLDVTGATTTAALSATNITASGTLGVTGNTTLSNITSTGTVNVTNNTQSSNTTTGSITTAGGLGVTKNVNIGGDTSIAGNATIDQDLTITGNLTINGSTTTIDSTVVTINDPTFEIGQSTQDDNLDRGIKFKYKNNTAKVGFFGMDDTDHKFTYVPDAIDSAGIFSGSVGTIKANIEGKIGDSNASTGAFTT